MLELLRGKLLCNVLIVVTRYFGGILLGTGGLVRAYAGATKQALEQATILQKHLGKQLEIDNFRLKGIKIDKMEEKYI